VSFYEQGLARLTDTWPGTGETGERFLAADHPYAADLDLFGRGSLFELVTTARIRAGEETLARWLLTAAEAADIRERQAAVRELQPRLDLREDLALLGQEEGTGVHPELLSRWSRDMPLVTSPWPRPTALVLAVVAVVTGIAWAAGAAGPGPFTIAVLLEIGFALAMRSRVRRILRDVEEPARDLALLAGVLARFERETFTSPKLEAIRRHLDTGGVAPSRRVAQLQRLIDLANSRQNQFFAPIAALLLWGSQVAFAIERWRLRYGPGLPAWLEALGEFEALCSLAGYAYEHPDDPMPEIVEDEPRFEGEALAHPLLPASTAVPNTVRLGGNRQMLLVSGSNMSGKSTLLRTVGTNAVLALAGAPVRARALTMSPLAVGATLRVQDSLQAGQSRFYAEITRLRDIVALTTGPRPVLFLLDELLSGTNSHDRQHGAEAIVRGLLDRGAIGLVTTHDLALSAIADRLTPRAENVHFADEFDEGTLRFDYRMRPGVVRTSNALALMRAVGLQV
jgi:DNA mismatch repair ATPase MutS